jgi:YebC/PmpR family DNA-binding regulatory protein
MSGHSHWAGIKHRKGVNDAKKAQIFTKHGKLISIAARDGGGGKPETNFQLRLAIERARMENMPKDKIERAIQRGTGELKGQAEIQEVMYEAYGPGQVAMLIKAATDNKNRALGDIRTLLTKNGGKMVAEGSVAFLFKKVGALDIEVNNNLEEVEMKAIEAGAEDTEFSENILTVYTAPENLQKTKEALEKNALIIKDLALSYIPLQKITLTEKDQLAYEKLLEILDEQEDVQEIYDNL